MEKNIDFVDLIKNYYELSGEEFLGVIKVVTNCLYCVSMKNENGVQFSTLVEICEAGNEVYAVERDACSPGLEEDMIEYHDFMDSVILR